MGKKIILITEIKYFTSTLILIETKNGEKFGFFFEDEIYRNRNEYFESNNNKCFIFSIGRK